MNAFFKDRFEAGRRLTEKLMRFAGSDAVVLAVPRGGLEIGYEVATRLRVPMDIVLSKKIGYPGNPEYAIGAVSLSGRVLNPDVSVSIEFIEAETTRIRGLLSERYELYHRAFQPPSLVNRPVILVDDGIATGQTLLVTVELVKQGRPRSITVAVPVAPPSSIEKLREKVDEVVCLETPHDFFAIGQFYEEFGQVSDEDAVALLEDANRSLPCPLPTSKTGEK